MSWRSRSAIIVFGLAAGFSTQAVCADLTVLPPDQQQAAKCMLSVVSAEKGVTNPRLQISFEPGAAASRAPSVHVFIEYSYAHSVYGDNISVRHIEVTKYLSPKKIEMIILDGTAPVGAPTTYLNDKNDGLIDIVAGWNRTCGLPLSADAA